MTNPSAPSSEQEPCAKCGGLGFVIQPAIPGCTHEKPVSCRCQVKPVTITTTATAPTIAATGDEPEECGDSVAPVGWWCTRKKGHDGPCAARKRCASCGDPLNICELTDAAEVCRKCEPWNNSIITPKEGPFDPPVCRGCGRASSHIGHAKDCPRAEFTERAPTATGGQDEGLPPWREVAERLKREATATGEAEKFREALQRFKYATMNRAMTNLASVFDELDHMAFTTEAEVLRLYQEKK